MKWENLLRIVGKEPVFSSSLLMSGNQTRSGIQLQLSRWSKSGKIIQLRRGWYVLAEPYRKVSPHPFLLANRLHASSYVSLQSALAFYGMIPEYVPIVTSITTGRPERIITSENTFVFKHIKKEFFSGYQQVEISDNQSVFIASPEKSFLDLVYMTPDSDSPGYLRELRLQNTENIDFDKLQETAEKSGSPKLRRAVKRIIKIIKEEEYRDL